MRSCGKGFYMIINAVCEKREQALCLAGLDGIDRIFSPEDIMPCIFRDRDAGACEAFLKREELLVRDYDSLAFLLEKGYSGRIRADHTLYTYNRLSRGFLEEAGVSSDTAPLELDHHELRQRGMENSELMVYGRIPMMISAGCVYKNSHNGSCKKEESVTCGGRSGKRAGKDKTEIIETVLTDRMGADFPVMCFCRYCYNVIFNSVPLSLHTERDRILRLSPASLRLYFTVEDEKMTRRTAEFFTACFKGDGRTSLPEVPYRAYTKGHFIKKTE